MNINFSIWEIGIYLNIAWVTFRIIINQQVRSYRRPAGSSNHGSQYQQPLCLLFFFFGGGGGSGSNVG